VPRLGPVGVDVFCREAQRVWPELRPYFDSRALKGAERVGLPTKPEKLAKLAGEDDLARLAAALVRVSRDKKLADSALTAPASHASGSRPIRSRSARSPASRTSFFTRRPCWREFSPPCCKAAAHGRDGGGRRRAGRDNALALNGKHIYRERAWV
jgi:hypothetical protein